MGDKRQDLLDALELELEIVVHKMKKGYQAWAPNNHAPRSIGHATAGGQNAPCSRRTDW